MTTRKASDGAGAKDERFDALVAEGIAAVRAAADHPLSFEEIQGAIGAVLADVMRRLREESPSDGISGTESTVEAAHAEPDEEAATLEGGHDRGRDR